MNCNLIDKLPVFFLLLDLLGGSFFDLHQLWLVEVVVVVHRVRKVFDRLRRILLLHDHVRVAKVLDVKVFTVFGIVCCERTFRSTDSGAAERIDRSGSRFRRRTRFRESRKRRGISFRHCRARFDFAEKFSQQFVFVKVSCLWFFLLLKKIIEFLYCAF